jgi:hypothetical protein
MAPVGLLTKEAAVKASTLSSRLTHELTRVLAKIEQRLDLYREKVLALAAVSGAIRTELARRKATYGSHRE